MESTHILGHIVDYEPMFHLVIKYLKKLEDEKDERIEDWFNTAHNKGMPRILDVPGLGRKRYTLRYDPGNGHYFVEDFKSTGGGWF